MVKIKLIWYILFWSAIFLYHWLVYGALNDHNYEGFFYWSILNTLLLAAATYFTIKILIEKYYLVGRRNDFFILVIFSLIGGAVIRRVLNYFIILQFFFPEKCNLPVLYLPRIFAEGFGLAMMSGMGAMFYFVHKWNQEREANQRLLNDKLEAQMELLKSQVQPHFIFNTLNNIYSLSISNPGLSSEMIYRLSGLLSYMLYDSKKTLISVEQELEYINHFIKLQKLRFGDRLDIVIQVFNNLDRVQIPPLLILPFVENCFKHGVSNELENCWIAIDFSVNEQELIIKIENSVPEQSYQNSEADKSGIGIENVRRRLEILYPEQYNLKVLASNETYLVILRLSNIYKASSKTKQKDTEFGGKKTVENV